MQLIFLRHGIAEERSGDQADFDRKLTQEGVSKTREVARGLKELIEKPEAILSSPRRRAVQTAELVGKAFGMKHEVMEALGGGDAKGIIEALGKRREQIIVAVGHEPDLSEVVEMLCFGRVSGRVQLRKAGAACLQCAEPVQVGGALLEWLATPKMLRGLAG